MTMTFDASPLSHNPAGSVARKRTLCGLKLLKASPQDNRKLLPSRGSLMTQRRYIHDALLHALHVHIFSLLCLCQYLGACRERNNRYVTWVHGESKTIHTFCTIMHVHDTNVQAITLVYVNVGLAVFEGNDLYASMKCVQKNPMSMSMQQMCQ